MFEFKDAEIEENAYILIDGVKHYVTPAKFKNGTNLTAEVLNQFVFEKGQNVNGNYIKFKNGIAICYNSIAYSEVLAGTEIGNLYRSNSLPLTRFPIDFLLPPVITYSLESTTEVGWLATLPGDEYQVTNTHPGKPVVVKTTPKNIDNITIGYIAIGQYQN